MNRLFSSYAPGIIHLFLITSIALIMPAIARSQPPPGFEASALPAASDYVVKNWMRVNVAGNTVGTNLNFQEPDVAILANDILLQQVVINGFGGRAKNIIVIANTIRIGAGNMFTCISNTQNGGDRNGSSLILICRKLVFTQNASFFYNGTSYNFQRYAAGLLPPPFTGSYGSQFLIACEHVEVDPQKKQEILNTQLVAFETYARDIIQNDATKATFQHSVLPSYLTSCIRLSWISSEDSIKYQTLINNTNTTNDDLLKTALELQRIILGREINIEAAVWGNLVQYNTARFSRIEFCEPKPPYYRLAMPMPSISTTKPYYKDDGKLPIMIGSGLMDPPVQLNQPLSYYFPSCTEVLGFLYGENTLTVLPTEHHKLFSQWAVEWIRYIRDQAQQASLLGNKVDYFDLLRTASEMPRYQLESPYDDNYNAIDLEVLRMLSDVQDLVTQKKLLLDAPLTGSIQDVFTLGLPPRYYLPTTEILLTGVHSGNNWDYGTLEEISNPDHLKRLRLQGELKSDPLIAATVANNLNSIGQGSNLQPGQLPNIQYDIKGVTGDGIKSFSATVVGSVANITVDIDPDDFEQVMFRFVNTGLPYYLDWTIPGNPVQEGQLGPLVLRLNRRTGGRIHVNGMQISNEEASSSAKISYVRTSTGRIIKVNDISVGPGKTISLSDISMQEGEYLLDVPAMGVVYDDGEGANSAGRFLILANGQYVDHVMVTNKIPASISPPGSGLTYHVRNVEIDLALVDPTSQAAIPFAHQMLSPDDSQGSTEPAETPRLLGNNNTYRVTGKVNFTDGGSAKLKSKDYTSPDITITMDDLDLKAAN